MKKFYNSKTMLFNFVMIVFARVLIELLGAENTLMTIAVANLVLRSVTKEGIEL